MALIDNLVSYWKLDEASGTREDIHGPNDLTANGTGGVGSGTGIINNAADLERGDSDYLSIADASQTGLDFTGDVALSCWLNIETAPSAQKYILASKNVTASNESYQFNYRDSAGTKRLQFISTTGGTGATETVLSKDTTISAGAWHHIVMSYDASAGTMTYYVDGSSLGTTAGGGTSIFSGTSPFSLGGSSAGDNFDGLMDEVGIWSRELTGAEVTSLYNGGAGLTYPFTTATRRVFVIS